MLIITIEKKNEWRNDNTEKMRLFAEKLSKTHHSDVGCYYKHNRQDDGIVQVCHSIPDALVAFLVKYMVPTNEVR